MWSKPGVLHEKKLNRTSLKRPIFLESAAPQLSWIYWAIHGFSKISELLSKSIAICDCVENSRLSRYSSLDNSAQLMVRESSVPRFALNVPGLFQVAIELPRS